LIPHHNDKNEDIEALANLIVDLESKYDAIDELDLLPYHKYGIYKYDLLAIGYKLKDLTPPTDREINRVKELLRKRLNMKIQIGG
jgi:pyruvate formate lyase activating enzyme